MIKVSILYSAAGRFDMDYYLNTHMPMAIRLLGGHPGYRGVNVAEGLPFDYPEITLAWSCICEFLFDSVEAFLDAYLPHSVTLGQDVPHYTDVTPVIQFSEVRLWEKN